MIVQRIFRDDELLAVDRDGPYGFEAAVEGVGEALVRMVVYDQAGNRVESVVVILVEGE